MVIVYFDTRGQNGRLAHCKCKNAACIFTSSCEPELAHRLQTSKMRRNSTSLDSCQHVDINIVTVSVARRRWTASLKSRRPCVKHFTTFYALVGSSKTRFTQGRLFYTQGPLFCALGPLFCALVREKAIFAVYKWCANEGFACMCKDKLFFFTHTCQNLVRTPFTDSEKPSPVRKIMTFGCKAI